MNAGAAGQHPTKGASVTHPDADAIVVGSGFGGAVAAARLAQAGFSVIVLERGRRWRPGDFPRAARLDDGWLWNVDQGLYDVRWLGGMLAAQAAGWGGGSLAYANVFTRPFDDALPGRWPGHLRRRELDPCSGWRRPVTTRARGRRPPAPRWSRTSWAPATGPVPRRAPSWR